VDAILTSEARPRTAVPPNPSTALDSVSIAIAGSGGSGVMTAGSSLLEAAARSGLYGLMVKTMGPQIRGGEAAALVRLGSSQMESLDDAFDIMLAIDWQNLHRFADEIPLRASGLLVCDSDAGEIHEAFTRTGARVLALPLKKMAKAIPGSWINMLALGIAGALAGVPAEALEQAVRTAGRRATRRWKPTLRALREGVAAAATTRRNPRKVPPAGNPRCCVSGNEGAVLRAARWRALRGGLPDHPATELLE